MDGDEGDDSPEAWSVGGRMGGGPLGRRLGRAVAGRGGQAENSRADFLQFSELIDAIW